MTCFLVIVSFMYNVKIKTAFYCVTKVANTLPVSKVCLMDLHNSKSYTSQFIIMVNYYNHQFILYEPHKI